MEAEQRASTCNAACHDILRLPSDIRTGWRHDLSPATLNSILKRRTSKLQSDYRVTRGALSLRWCYSTFVLSHSATFSTPTAPVAAAITRAYSSGPGAMSRLPLSRRKTNIAASAVRLLPSRYPC